MSAIYSIRMELTIRTFEIIATQERSFYRRDEESVLPYNKSLEVMNVTIHRWGLRKPGD